MVSIPYYSEIFHIFSGLSKKIARKEGKAPGFFPRPEAFLRGGLPFFIGNALENRHLPIFKQGGAGVPVPQLFCANPKEASASRRASSRGMPRSRASRARSSYSGFFRSTPQPWARLTRTSPYFVCTVS